MLVCSLAFITLVIYDQRDSADWAFGCIFFPASHGVRGRAESYRWLKRVCQAQGILSGIFRRRRATPPPWVRENARSSPFKAVNVGSEPPRLHRDIRRECVWQSVL